jgi:hypothetical protein
MASSLAPDAYYGARVEVEFGCTNQPDSLRQNSAYVSVSLGKASVETGMDDMLS